MIFRVRRSPFSPSGEKVADRPDEGELEDGGALTRPHHLGPLPQCFAKLLPFDSTQHPQKLREREQLRAVQLSGVKQIIASAGVSDQLVVGISSPNMSGSIASSGEAGFDSSGVAIAGTVVG